MVLLFSMVYRETFTLLLFVVGAVLSQELLTNGDFEDPTRFFRNWRCTKQSSTCEESRDSHSGNTSVIITNRLHQGSGVRRTITALMNDGEHYNLEGWIKVVNTSDLVKPMIFVPFLVYDMLRPDFTEERPKYQRLVTMYITEEDGWVKFRTDFSPIDRGDNTLEACTFAIRLEDAGTENEYPDYILDSISMTKIIDDPEWRTKAEKRIEKNRKSKLNVKLIRNKGKPAYSNITLTIKQTYSEFGFGSAVDAFQLEHNEGYRKTYLDNFEWANVEGEMIWRKTEYSKNILTWEAADVAMKILEENEKRIRGGNIHEAVVDDIRTPDFIRTAKNPSDVYRQCMKRVDYLLGQYRYRCEDWTVVNNMFSENENFLNKMYGSEKINADLHRRAKDIDFAANLYLNEAGLLTDNPSRIQVMVDGIKKLKTQGAPVEGIGIDVHMENPPSASIFINRLNNVGKAGLPIWLNNYIDSKTDASVRAITFDEMLTAALGEPMVTGIMLKDFWDWNGYESPAFFEGENFTPNAAGIALKNRVAEITAFNEEIFTFSIASEETVSVPEQRLYHGEYEFIFKSESDGKVIKTEKIAMHSLKGDRVVELRI